MCYVILHEHTPTRVYTVMYELIHAHSSRYLFPSPPPPPPPPPNIIDNLASISN